MPIVKLPISGGAYKNIDEINTGPFSTALINGFPDEIGNTNRVPGLLEFINVGTDQAVDGLYWWDTQGILITVSGGKIFKTTDAAGTTVDITGDAPVAGARPTFADFGDKLYLANGGQIIKVLPTGNSAYIADIDAPTTVTHIAAIDTYLVANETGTQTVWVSKVLDPDTWEGNFFTAEGMPDDVSALAVAWGEIVCLGKQSLEVFQNDGSTPFVPNPNSYTEAGAIAPYSLVLADNAWTFLDIQRRLVRIEGRTPKIISQAMNKYIQSFGNVTDCRVDDTMIDGRPYLILHFPSEGKTLAYDYSLGDPQGWFELARWNSVSSEFERWIGNCFVYASTWGFSLVGDYRSGKIYKASVDYYDNDGETLKTLRRSPTVDHDTSVRKRCNKLTVRLKRSNVASEDLSPTLLVRWRDNGSTFWSNQRTIQLGKVSDTSYIGYLRGPLGAYRTRQWEFVLTDSAPLIIVSAEEDVELLKS